MPLDAGPDQLAITPERIADWLGLDPRDPLSAIEVRPDHVDATLDTPLHLTAKQFQVGCWSTLAVSALVWMTGGFGTGPWPAVFLAIVVVPAVGVVLMLKRKRVMDRRLKRRRVSAVRATPYRLGWRNPEGDGATEEPWREVPWRSVVGLELASHDEVVDEPVGSLVQVRVAGTAGPILDTGLPGATDLLQALERVVAANQTRAARKTERQAVPSGALSVSERGRMREAEDTGLSRVAH